MNLTDADVQEILGLLESSPYGELRITTDRFQLTLRRGSGDAQVWLREARTVGAGTPIVTRVQPVMPAPIDDGRVSVMAPLPGTLYRAPKPGAVPFVQEGSDVGEDTVVCIIETMKLMNAVPAGVRGTVAEICVENGQQVDSGQIVMRITPALT